MPSALSGREMAGLDHVVKEPLEFSRGRHLYRSGEPFKAIYVVRTGIFMSDVLSNAGHQQVTGFPMPGEVLGLDGIVDEVHSCNAVALEDSQVCAIPFAELEALACETPLLQRYLHKLMSREIVRDHGVMMLLGALRAEERVAAFLLNLSQRLAARGLSPTEFCLPMSRDAIGSYLGIQLETVSRAFSRFHDEGVIAVRQRHIRILDLPRLKRLLGSLSKNSLRVAPSEAWPPSRSLPAKPRHWRPAAIAAFSARTGVRPLPVQ
jgi:CRP/FNR family transcriptional regulator